MYRTFRLEAGCILQPASNLLNNQLWQLLREVEDLILSRVYVKKDDIKQNDDELFEILSLVTEMKEGTISTQRFLQLDKMLSVSPERQGYYLDVIKLYADLEFLFKHLSHPVS